MGIVDISNVDTSLIKSPGLNNVPIGQEFIGLINDVFNNYRLFQTSGDIKAYIK